MSLLDIKVNWVDFAILLVVLVGVARGRKRGMSEELLDMLKWVLIVLAAGFFYEPAGRLLAANTIFSLLSCYVAVYALTMLGILFGFSCLRRWVGAKLVGSDAFGDAEYYLGMVAGAFRYGCIVLVFMAFLNARYFTPQEVRARYHFQNENFGNNYFPTLADVQRAVFDQSLMGRMVQDSLYPVLIRPTSPQDKGLGEEDAIFRRRERQVNDVLAK